MIEYPYFLLLFLLFLVYFYYRKNVKFYFRHAYLDGLGGERRRKFTWEHWLLIGLAFLILAACGFVWRTKELAKVYQVHRYVLVNDGSGSMVVNKPNGIGVELASVLAGNDRLLDAMGSRKDGSKDLVGAVVFSNESFIVSSLSDDPEFVRKKLKRIDYRMPPLNLGTNVEAGLWTALEMLLSHDGFIQQDVLNHLQAKFYGQETSVKVDDKLESIIARKDKFVGGSIILFTDGYFNAPGNKVKMSSYKIVDFCRLVGIKVYLISLFSLDQKLVQLCRETGGRGEIVKGFNRERLEEIYEDIFNSQAGDYEMREQVVDVFVTELFGLLGLYFILVGMVLHFFTELNYTEV